MSYTLKLDDDSILHLAIIGTFDQEDADAYMAEATELITANPPKQKMLILVDTKQASGKMNPMARKMIMDLYRRNQEGKVAIVGLSPYVRVMTSMASKIMGQSRTGYFDTKEEALEWLKSR
jgi:hypothetical protein